MMELIRDFAAIDKDDTAVAGGKGASLGEMVQAGFPVPAGFVILSSAFTRFLEEAKLGARVYAALGAVDRQAIQSIETASKLIRQLIADAEVPNDIAKEIHEAFETLDVAYVAVRSSATVEDSASATWAGQLESYLNVTEQDLVANVKKCWASLFTPRAVFYSLEKGLAKEKASVAVVMQKMVASDAAGVAFSVHPVTQNKNELVIEAGIGLGEAVVSGQVTPDNYVIEKTSGRVRSTVSTQTRGLFRSGDGGCEWKKIPEPQASSQVLTAPQITELAGLVTAIEAHYGFPCDIEWALENGRLYIVQSRAITTLV